MKKIIGLLFLLCALVVGNHAVAAGGYSINVSSSSVNGMQVTLNGSASADPYIGNDNQQKVEVSSWGDASNDPDATENFIFVDGPGNNDSFTGTWNASHTYAAPGTYTITVKVCHQNCNGNEGSDFSTDTEVITVTPPPVPGKIVVVKDVLAADGDTDISDSQQFSVKVGNETKTVSEGNNAEFTGLEVGTYSVSEVNIPEGYALMSVSSPSVEITSGLTVTVTVTNKVKTACNDGVDNDNDDKKDMQDPGCSGPNDDDETDPVVPPLPACGDGEDNDGDTLVDFPADLGCTSAQDTDETDAVVTPTTGGLVIVKNVVGADGQTEVSNTTSFTVHAGELTASVAEGTNAEFSNLTPGTYTISEDASEGYSLVSISSESAVVVAGATTTVTVTNKVKTACNDGVDNDEDKKTDLLDPGCSGPEDTDETDPETPAVCNDDSDNDEDGFTDFPEDPGCESVGDNDETDPVVTTGDLVIVKDVEDLEDNTEFTVTIGGETSSSFAEGSSAVFYGLEAGVYNVSEINIPEGYELVSISDETADVVAGATTTVTVVNRKLSVENPDDTDEDEDGNRPGSRRRTSSGQGQVLGASTSRAEEEAGCGLYLEKFLRIGYPNDAAQVSKMQKFLALHLEIPLPQTGVFGTMTEEAVKKFQALYRSEVLTPWGITEPTGIVYMTTARKINSLMCPALNLPIPTNLVEWSE